MPKTCLTLETFWILLLLLGGLTFSQANYEGVKHSGIYSLTITENNLSKTIPVFKNDCPKFLLGYKNMAAKDEAPLTLFKNRSISWAKFTLNKSIVVSVTVKNISKVPVNGKAIRILPSRHKVQGEVSGNTITFTLQEPGQYSLEIGGEGYKNGLMLFADPPETDIPSKQDENFLVLQQAEASDVSNISTSYNGIIFDASVHDIGLFTIPKHIKNVYFEDGSWVYGALKMDNNPNVRIYGRGILSAAKMNYREHHSVEAINGSHNIIIEGLVVADPKYFAVRLIGANNQVSYTKVIGGWVYNCDGIAAFRGSKVSKSFIWANDDAIKIYRDSIHWEDIVVWQLNNGGVIQTSWGGAIGGSHAIGSSIRRLDVLRAEWNESRKDYFNCGLLNMVGNRYQDTGRRDSLSNWVIEDVVTENPIPLVFNLTPDTYTDAHIDGITLKNWNVKMTMETNFQNEFIGPKSQNFRGFVFDNVKFNGQLLTNGNCIINGTMSDGGWVAVPKTTNQTLQLLENKGVNATMGLKSVVTGMGQGNHYVIKGTEYLSLEQGETIEISFQAKSKAGSPRLVSWVQDAESNAWMNVGDHQLTNTWSTYKATITMDKTSSSKYQIKFRGYENATIYIDNVKIGPPSWKKVLAAKTSNMDTPVFYPSLSCINLEDTPVSIEEQINTSSGTLVKIFGTRLLIENTSSYPHYQILDTFGRIVSQGQGTEVDISLLAPGSYILNVEKHTNFRFHKM